MAGYSGTPLVRKLGIKPDSRLLLLQAPSEFALADVPDGVVQHRRASRQQYDTILFFTTSRDELAQKFAPAAQHLTTAGGLWISWPKKASGVSTDLTENVVRDIGLEAGLVDVKVCAIDETWSGLRFVRRLKDR